MKKKRRKGKVLPKPPLPKKTSFIHRLKFLMKKAQTAMEYVLTYGWAVLIILFAISSLFYIGVFEPKTPNTCLIEAPFVCNDVKAYDDTIIYTINSQNVKTATITDVLINGQSCNILGGSLIVNPGQNTFNVNSQNQIICMGFPDLYQKASSEIILNYETQQGLQHTITGTSSANIEDGLFQIDYTLLNDPDMIFALNFENGFTTLGSYPGESNVYGNIQLESVENIGQVAHFDGIDDFIEFPKQPSLNTENLTIEFLVKFEQTPAIEFPIFVKEDQTRFNYGFYFNSNNKLELRINIGNMTGGCIATVESDQLNLNEWYHIVGTFDMRDVILYINGEEEGRLPGCSPNILQNEVGIFIGSDTYRPQRFFKGYLDSIVLYKDALTSREIQKHYEHFTPPNPPPQL